jgi:hypothetical protein
MKFRLLVVLCFSLLSACTATPPRNTEDICRIFQEKDDWYDATQNAAKRWGTPIAVQMAIIHQESKFVADALPPRPLILGFIPWFRASSAYGYPQAKDEAWADYQTKAGNGWASREDFADSTDFVAWYCAVSHKKLGIPVTDANNLYLTYHEGLGGYQHKSHLSKQWLLTAAQKVQQRALRYNRQLSACKADLDANN